MIFKENILEREDIIQCLNSGPPVGEKVTKYGPAIVQMLAPKPAKTYQDSADIFTPYAIRDFKVFEKN